MHDRHPYAIAELCLVAVYFTMLSPSENQNYRKFLNFQMPENFVVIYLKFKQKAQTLR